MNLTLIGMAGVGKSVIGKELARALGFTFIDTDEVIEERLHLKLQEILDRFGEDRFLQIEEETILNLGLLDHSVISPGGSVIYSSEAMRFLKANSVVVFLDAPFKSIGKRIPNQWTRGIVGLKNKKLDDLFDERLPLYRKYADVTIEMDEGFDKEAVLQEIVERVLRRRPV